MSAMSFDRVLGITLCLPLLLLAPCAPASAQEAQETEQLSQAELDAEEEALAKMSQNPIANLISVPLQSNNFFNLGPYDRTRSVVNVQPVIPIQAGAFNIITRTIIPLMSQPDLTEPSGSTTGIADITLTAFITPAKASKLIWGVGPVILLPTGTDDRLTTKKWGLGPSAVAVTMSGPWVAGILVSQLWSIAGDEDRPDISQFLTQYFVNYNLANGWFLTSAPIITANWNAPDGNTWTVPFGGGFGKVFRIGSQAMNFNTQLFYNAVRPDDLPSANVEWRFQLNFLFPR